MLIVSNWKAYVDSSKDALALVKAAGAVAQGEHTLVLAPPAPLLGIFAAKGAVPKGVYLAAQDFSNAEGGAATGETTAVLLKGMGITYSVIGHSERRARGETNEEVAAKVARALSHGITPIVCIGEPERDAEAQYLGTLREQIATVLEPLSKADRARVIFAYEPIWAIGKSAAESIQPDDLHEMVLYIRKSFAQYVPESAALKIPILYGGSVEPANIASLAQGSAVDGFLIGHASVDPVTYRTLVKALG